MGNIKETLFNLWDNRKIRDTFILAFMAIILCYLVVRDIQYMKYSAPRDEGIKRICICPKCGFQEERIVFDLGDTHCTNCNELVGFAWQCTECGKKFSCQPTKITRVMTKEELNRKREIETRCPNCGSVKTCPFAEQIKTN